MADLDVVVAAIVRHENLLLLRLLLRVDMRMVGVVVVVLENGFRYVPDLYKLISASTDQAISR